MDYTKDAIKGISWIGFLSFLTKSVGLVEILILAKILTPNQFGAYSIALLALGLLETLTETGVNIVLLQEDSIDKYISSAWIVSIIRGILISIVLVVLTPLISIFFHSPDSAKLLYLISTVPLLRGFINPAVVKFQKELNFNKNFFYQAFILFTDTLFSISIVYLSKNPLGIIVGLIAGVVAELILSFSFIKPRPTIKFQKDYLSMIFHRGKWITGIAVFDYIFHNLDNVVVGRILGESSLGIYQLAYSIAVMPIEEIGKVFVHVGVPILIKLRSDKERFENSYIKLIFFSLLISLPFAIFVFLLPNFFVFILGSKWSGVTIILPILSLLGLVKGLTNVSGSVFLSNKKQKYATVINLVSVAIFALIIVPMVLRSGTLGAAASALLSSLIAIPFIFYFVFKTLQKEQ